MVSAYRIVSELTVTMIARGIMIDLNQKGGTVFPDLKASKGGERVANPKNMTNGSRVVS